MNRKAIFVGHISGFVGSVTEKTVGLVELNKHLAEGYEIEAVHQMSPASAAGGAGSTVTATLGCLVLVAKA